MNNNIITVFWLKAGYHSDYFSSLLQITEVYIAHLDHLYIHIERDYEARNEILGYANCHNFYIIKALNEKIYVFNIYFI